MLPFAPIKYPFMIVVPFICLLQYSLERLNASLQTLFDILFQICRSWIAKVATFCMSETGGMRLDVVDMVDKQDNPNHATIICT